MGEELPPVQLSVDDAKRFVPQRSLAVLVLAHLVVGFVFAAIVVPPAMVVAADTVTGDVGATR